MSNENNSLEEIKKKYFGFSKTIRSLIISGLLAAVYAVLDMAVIQPLMEEYSEVSRSIEKAKSEGKGFAANLLNLQGVGGIDPSLSDKKQLEVLTVKLNELEHAIDFTTKRFVSPTQMSQFINDVVKKSNTLSLVSMKTTIPTSIIIKTEKKVKVDVASPPKRSNRNKPVAEKIETIAEDKIFKHNVKFTFYGKYADIANFIQKVEEMEWGVYWQSLELHSEKFPYSTVSIELYTLSLEKNWLTL